MSLDIVTVGGTLFCLNPANLSCLMHTFDKKKKGNCVLFCFLLERTTKTSGASRRHFGGHVFS